MESQRDDKPETDDPLRNQTQRLLARALRTVLLVEFMQLFANWLRQLRTVAENVEFLDQDTGR